MDMDIKRIGVVGAGQMGNGIAHVAAVAGYDVQLQDISDAALGKARSTIEANLGRMVRKERLTASDAEAALGRIDFGSDESRMADRDLLIEAATENVDLKFRIFQGLDRIARPGAILASNTSSISITAMAAQTEDHSTCLHMCMCTSMYICVMYDMLMHKCI